MKAHTKGVYLAVLCSITYAFAYMCRVNLSAAIDKMAIGFNTSIAAVGIFGTIQTFIYASGQLINGYIVSRHKPRLVILTAVVGSAAANLLMGLVNSYLPALILWAINAYLQSLFWAAIVRIINAYPESRGDTSLMFLIIVLPVSYVLSWSVIAYRLDAIPSWHPYFVIPGILLMTLTPFWLTMNKACPETDELQSHAVVRTPMEIFAYIRSNHITLYCVTSILSGVLREGVLFWAPVLLARILTGSTLSPYLTVTLIPLGRIPSTLLLRVILPRYRNYTKLSVLLFAGTIFFCVLMLIPNESNLVFVILIALLTLLSTMLGSLLSVYVPMSYADDNMSAPVAGLLDALIYLGGAISTLALGHILTSGSLTGAVIFWIGTAILGVLLPMIMTQPKHS